MLEAIANFIVSKATVNKQVEPIKSQENQAVHRTRRTYNQNDDIMLFVRLVNDANKARKLQETGRAK